MNEGSICKRVLDLRHNQIPRHEGHDCFEVSRRSQDELLVRHGGSAWSRGGELLRFRIGAHELSHQCRLSAASRAEEKNGCVSIRGCRKRDDSLAIERPINGDRLDIAKEEVDHDFAEPLFVSRCTSGGPMERFVREQLVQLRYETLRFSGMHQHQCSGTVVYPGRVSSRYRPSLLEDGFEACEPFQGHVRSRVLVTRERFLYSAMSRFIFTISCVAAMATASSSFVQLSATRNSSVG